MLEIKTLEEGLVSMFVIKFLFLLIAVGIFCAGGFLVGIAKDNILIYGLFSKRKNRQINKDRITKDVKKGFLLMFIGLALILMAFRLI